MKTRSLDIIIKQFSKNTVALLIELAGQGKQLTPEALYSNSLWRHNIQDLISESCQQAATGSGTLDNADEIIRIQTHMDMVVSQKERLIKQLNESDHYADAADSFYKSVLTGLIDLFCGKEESSDLKALVEFKNRLRDKSGLDQVEAAFNQLKNQMIKEPPDKAKKPAAAIKPFAFFKGRLNPFRGEKDRYTIEAQLLERLRGDFQNMVDEIRLTCFQEDLSKIFSVENQIKRMINVEDYISAKHSFIFILHQHILTLYNERQQASAFIREIGERFVEMENHVIESALVASDAYVFESEFNVVLKQQIDELNNKVHFSKTLTGLKQTMFARLSTIKQIIEKKHDENTNRKTEADKQIALLRKTVDQMKLKIDESRQHVITLEKEAMLDPLTGIYNRRAYDRQMKAEFQRYLRYKQIFSLLLFDVDFFKQVNDAYGHAVGDKCLKEIVNRVQKVIRESDYMARFGGEEFIVILPVTDEKAAGEVAEKIRSVVERTEFIHKSDIVKITISVGGTTIRPDDKDQNVVFQRLDLAMYEAKKKGRNNVVMA